MARQYSRMSKIQERRNFRRAVLFMLAILLIVAFMFTIGFSLLAKIFIFMGDLKSNTDKENEKTDFIPPGPPQLVVPIEATNSAMFSLKGIAEPEATVHLAFNDEDYESMEVSQDGIFEFKNLFLELGINTFSAIAEDEAGNRSQSSLGVSIFYSTTPPELEISFPQDQQVFTGNEYRITVKGKTDSGVKVLINDRVAIVDSAGGFQKQIELNPGDNVVVITATDSAGNQERKEIIVVYRR